MPNPKNMSAWTRSAACLAISLFIAACGGDPDPVAGEVVSATDANLPAVTAADVKQIITYRMPGVNGPAVDASGVVLIPASTPPEGGWPVIGWGHGTTGVADQCAPSASSDLATYDTYLNLFVAAGYAVVAPDYEGLGTPGGHPFLHLDSEGRSLLYAVRAAVSHYPSLSSRYALLGHSQGGHAVIGAAELANANEVDGLTLVGVAALAPASQVSAQGSFLEQVANNPAAPITERVNAAVGRIAFSSLILAGIEAIDSSFDDADSYGLDGGFIPDLAASQCLDGISSGLFAPIQNTLGSNNSIASILPGDVEDDTRVASYLEQLEPGFREIGPPVLLIQGDQDSTVFPSSTQQLLTNMSTLGNRVSLDTVTGATHSSVPVESFTATRLFLDDQFENAP